MAAKMKAFVMKSVGNVGVIEKPVPSDPGPNHAIVKNTKALICISDAHTVEGAIGEKKYYTRKRTCKTLRSRYRG
jgi:isopropanol dehydrogenase (NADP+)